MEKRINIMKLTKKDRDAIMNIRPRAKAIIEEVKVTKDDKLDLILQFVEEQRQFNKIVINRLDNLENKMDKYHPE